MLLKLPHNGKRRVYRQCECVDGIPGETACQTSVNSLPTDKQAVPCGLNGCVDVSSTRWVNGSVSHNCSGDKHTALRRPYVAPSKKKQSYQHRYFKISISRGTFRWLSSSLCVWNSELQCSIEQQKMFGLSWSFLCEFKLYNVVNFR